MQPIEDKEQLILALEEMIKAIENMPPQGQHQPVSNYDHMILMMILVKMLKLF